MFHQYISKSKKEIKEQMDDLKKKRELKAERKRVQDQNVKRKQEEKDAKHGVKPKEEGTKEEDGEERPYRINTGRKQVRINPVEQNYNDADFDESKDVRAMPKKPMTSSLVGKKRARPE